MPAAETSTTHGPIRAIHHAFSSFDEFARVLDPWALDFRQLDRGPLKATVQQVATPSVLVSRFTLNRRFHQHGMSPPGMRTFGIVDARSTPVEWNGREGTANQIEVFPATDEFECVSHPEFHGSGVSIPENRLRAVAEILGVPDPIETIEAGPTFIESDSYRMETLRRSLKGLFAKAAKQEDVPLDGTASDDLEFEVVSAMIAALASSRAPVGRIPRPTLRSRALKIALDYIEEHAGGAPTVTDICRASGSSYRTLNYAFLDRFGITPKRYLQAVRLDGARKHLQRSSADDTISDIANRWGFWHMGQFAADYRRQFGELPSETARRS